MTLPPASLARVNHLLYRVLDSHLARNEIVASSSVELQRTSHEHHPFKPIKSVRERERWSMSRHVLLMNDFRCLCGTAVAHDTPDALGYDERTCRWLHRISVGQSREPVLGAWRPAIAATFTRS